MYNSAFCYSNSIPSSISDLIHHWRGLLFENALLQVSGSMLSSVCKSFSKMKLNCFEQKMFISSPSLVPLQLPSRMETHFWYVLPNEVKSESLLSKYMDLLSPSEKDHVFSFRGDELRKGALLARALVRTTITRYQINSQVSPRSLKFERNTHGKPEVIWPQNDDWDPPPLHFNLSHTSSLIACGVTMDSPIGIDVEEKRRTMKNNILSFARRYFSCQEVKVLAAISDPEVQRREFIKLWTLKEAYVKALGRGFSGAPFNTFTIRFGPATGGSFHASASPNSEDSAIAIEPLQNCTNLTTNWEFALVELVGSHYAAICRERDELSIGQRSVPMKLTVWKTIPLVEDLCVSGTDAVVPVAGLT